jgi:hypothetical protein
VLLKLSADNSVARIHIHNYIFPLENDSVSLISSEEQMIPPDASEGTLRFKLIQLMTDSNTSIKRLVSELLFEICDQDGKFSYFNMKLSIKMMNQINVV